MSKKFVLAVNSLDQEYDPFAFAIVEIGSELAGEIRRRKAILDAAQAQDARLYALHFWDSTPEYYVGGADSAHLPEDVDVAVRDVLTGDRDVIDYPKNLGLSECEVGRTEADMIVITADGFRWETAEKHSGTGIATATLGYDVLNDEDGGAVVSLDDVAMGLLVDPNEKP